ncbi:MAG: HU family DNA-binding protein [Candidatus Azobacteroides sp.]|nr:HU family DNA-binding protein [Candidatus Azobacteroides sp.]
MREKINLQELTTLLSDKAGISKKDADAFLREFFGLMTDSLIEDKQVKIKNLGTFRLTEVENRESVNVRTGARVLIPAHTKISYIQDNTLSEIINKPYEALKPKIIEETTSFQEPEKMPETKKIKTKIQSEPLVNPVIIEEKEEKIIAQKERRENIQGKKIKEKENIFEETPASENIIPSFEPGEDEVSDVIAARRKKHVLIVVFTFLAVSILLVIFYFLSRDNKEVTNYARPVKTAYDLEKKEKEEKNDEEVVYGETGETINPADTVMPIKQTLTPGKKRKTKVGERLTMISFEEYGDPVFWIYIYDENKNLITKDNYVKAGIELTIPSPEKYDIDKTDPKSIQKARDFAINYKHEENSQK